MAATESMLVTSSYVSVPAMDTSPLKVAATPVMFPVTSPTKVEAVTIPE